MIYGLADEVDEVEQAPVWANYSTPMGQSHHVRVFRLEAQPFATNRSAIPESDYSVVIPATGISFSGSFRFATVVSSLISDSFEAASSTTDLLEFKSLVMQWKTDTRYSSSLEEICSHPAYQTIMAMGREALPWILKDLSKQFGHWFYALQHIARKDIGKGAKDLEDARRRWL